MYNLPKNDDSYEFYNIHPKGLTTTDCVKRALSLALNKPYEEVAKDLLKIAKDLNFELGYKLTKRCGCYHSKGSKFIAYDKKKKARIEKYRYTFNNPKVYEKYLEGKVKWLAFNAEPGQSRINGKGFAESKNKGRYILRMAGHLSCCIDGIIYDIWDCRDKCVYGVWKVLD